MALSFSRPDVTSPASVAEATFPTARKGLDPTEVRSFLRAVAAELGRLQERERFLERELRTVREAQAAEPVLDDETVSRLLGEETLRVLQTARESASQIKVRAEEGAARILREATEEATRLREEAQVEAARRRSDAVADAEAEVSLAKQQGREMVNEARAYRERVLSELARRRELARQQIEQLVVGRDRLLQAFERARVVAVDVVAELAPLGEPEEYVNLAPTTGPVPVMLPADRTDSPEPEAADDAARAIGEQDATGSDDDAQVRGGDIDDADTDGAEMDGADMDGADTVEVTGPVDTTEPADTADDATAATTSGGDAEASAAARPAESTNVVELFARLRAEAGTAADVTSGDAPTDDVAAEPAPPAEEPPAGGAATDSIFTERDEALVPLILTSARKIKRVLADEQNGVLDALRRREPVRDLAALLPDADEHAARYADAIGSELDAAAAAGGASVSAGAATIAADLTAVRAALRDDLVGPLRDRLSSCVADGGGDNDEVTRAVRAVYREWKTQQIDDQLDDVLRLAHGVGAMHAIAPGTPVCWMVDPHGPACPDAEDNALAGAVPAGEPFPTGHRFAPAHVGCRCLLAPTRQ